MATREVGNNLREQRQYRKARNRSEGDDRGQNFSVKKRRKMDPVFVEKWDAAASTKWNPYFYCPGGLVFVTNWSIYLVTCWLHDLLIYLLNWDIDVLTDLVTYWLCLLHVTEWMTCLDCMAIGGLHDCASLFLVLFTVNFMMNPKSALHCANCKGSGY